MKTELFYCRRLRPLLEDIKSLGRRGRRPL
jgi:hypothetical protein